MYIIQKTNKRAQAALEFMTTYVWVLMSVLVTVGALIYFNVFDTSKYIPDECLFGQNIYCEDWSLEKTTAARFSLTLKLKNNLERIVEMRQVRVFDDNDQLLACATTNMYCPYQSGDLNWSGGIFDGGWKVGQSCRLFLVCDKAVIEGTKERINVELTFRRQALVPGADHTINGRVYSKVIP